MSVRQSLLAILDQGACYGYQLRSEFERRTGATWPLNAGQIYNTLDRLERDGMVDKAGVDGEGHVYYTITAAGRAEVREWLSSPVVRSAAARDELAIKLAVALTLPGVDITEVVQVQRRATLRALQDLTKAKHASDDPARVEDLAGLLVLDSLIFTAEAEIRWLDHTESRLRRARETGMAIATPLRSDPPRRGRPAGIRHAAATEGGPR